MQISFILHRHRDSSMFRLSIFSTGMAEKRNKSKLFYGPVQMGKADGGACNAKYAHGRAHDIASASRHFELDTIFVNKIRSLLVSWDLHDCDYWYDVALQDAARPGHQATVQLLLEEGANVNGNGDEGATPLICAADAGQGKMVETLLSKGANIHRANDSAGLSFMQLIGKDILAASKF